ncbi:hypothetical protein CPB84DRAFT_1794708 [Gymnopilus junonius]|uniref:Acyltransferase 3 domain-containing protein n=1 Tax=Gymnopilus junonius TaxID=109634 RepID=A0A9P5NCN5_GYMJU|nr:hypothetical protein CPB84DRAFT_1794708 [Gymnopilus junonius]
MPGNFEREPNSLPLLIGKRSQRLHYLDNLRALLTVILIFHHAVYRISPAQQDILAIFHLINRSALWALFFFVSGRSAGLALSRLSDYQFFLSRALSSQWKVVFGGPGMSTPLSGPAAYILILLILDSLLLLFRWAERIHPEFIPSKFLNRLQPTSERHFTNIVALVLTTLVAWRFIHSSLNQLDFRILHLHIIDTNDEPGADAPLSYIVAYLFGLNFDRFKKYIIMDLPAAYISLFISLFAAYATMWLYLSIIIWQFPGSRFRLTTHNFLFAFWDTYLFYTIPVPLISIFSEASWATRDWGVLVKHTYIQSYLNMIPVLLALHWFKWVESWPWRAVIAGSIGVMASWLVMLLSVTLRNGLVRLVRRHKINRTLNALRRWA